MLPPVSVAVAQACATLVGAALVHRAAQQPAASPIVGLAVFALICGAPLIQAQVLGGGAAGGLGGGLNGTLGGGMGSIGGAGNGAASGSLGGGLDGTGTLRRTTTALQPILDKNASLKEFYTKVKTGAGKVN